MPKFHTVRSAVLAINRTIWETDLAVFVAPDQTRIARASGDHGKLCVYGMFTHKWITLTSKQELGVWRGARCLQIYRWIGPYEVEIQ